MRLAVTGSISARPSPLAHGDVFGRTSRRCAGRERRGRGRRRAVFAMWVGIDGLYPKQGELLARLGMGQAAGPASPWNPHMQFGQDSPMAWLFIGVRILGSSFLVPPLEEVFFRSFLYRYMVKHEFPVRSVESIRVDTLPGHFASLRLRAPGMAGGHSLRVRIPGPGLLEGSAGRCYRRPCDHQLPPWDVGGVAWSLGFLVSS